MTAPTNITPPVVARYSAVVLALKPGCIDGELRARCGILYLRDRATAAMRIAGWEAANVLQAIVSLATVHGLRPMPESELDALHYSLTRLMATATHLEQHGPREVTP